MDTVFGLPAQARPVADLDRHHRTAAALDEGRQETVHVIEERQVKEGLAVEELEATAGVGNGIAEQASAHRVGDA